MDNYKHIEVYQADCCESCQHYTSDSYEPSGFCELLKKYVSDTNKCSEYKEY